LDRDKKKRRAFYREPINYSSFKRMRFRFHKKWKPDYIRPRAVKNFYLVLTKKNYRKYKENAAWQNGYFFSNYLIYLECRLFMLVHRTNFISNMFLIKSIINLKNFFILNCKTFNSYPNYQFYVGDFIQVSNDYKELLKKDLEIRLLNNTIFWKPPYFLYVNYKFMFLFIWRRPKLKYFPDYYDNWRFDIFKGGSYYI
jgi:hypothetical protein